MKLLYVTHPKYTRKPWCRRETARDAAVIF